MGIRGVVFPQDRSPFLRVSMVRIVDPGDM